MGRLCGACQVLRFCGAGHDIGVLRGGTAVVLWPAHLLTPALRSGGLGPGRGIVLARRARAEDWCWPRRPGRWQAQRQGRSSQGCAAERSRIWYPDHDVSRPPAVRAVAVWTASELLVGSCCRCRNCLKLVKELRIVVQGLQVMDYGSLSRSRRGLIPVGDIEISAAAQAAAPRSAPWLPAAEHASADRRQSARAAAANQLGRARSRSSASRAPSRVMK